MNKEQRSRAIKIGGIVLAISLILVVFNSLGNAEPIICDPGFHLENGVCVADPIPINCPTGYAVASDSCYPTLPARSTTTTLATTIRRTDHSITSEKFNVWVYVPSHYTGTFRLHVILFDPTTNTEVDHQTRDRSLSNANSGYLNNYFNFYGLQGCRTYHTFAYTTSVDGTIAYSGVERLDVNTSGCPMSIASLLSFFGL